jgi:hypothetical protein
MDKSSMLLKIAETAYNVGFGAKKHFATYDIVEKAPGWIGFISLAVGVFALVVDMLATKHISAVLIVLGMSGLLINCYNDTKLKYEEAGKQLTVLFNGLKSLYFAVKSSSKTDFREELDEVIRTEREFYASSISKQILFSDWYAHYKFFWQHQIDWVDEQKKFTLWRDKVPLSLTATVVIVCMSLVLSLVLYCARSMSLV